MATRQVSQGNSTNSLITIGIICYKKDIPNKEMPCKLNNANMPMVAILAELEHTKEIYRV